MGNLSQGCKDRDYNKIRVYLTKTSPLVWTNDPARLVQKYPPPPTRAPASLRPSHVAERVYGVSADRDSRGRLVGTDFDRSGGIGVELPLEPIARSVILREYAYITAVVENNVVEKGIEHVLPCQQGDPKSDTGQECSIFAGLEQRYRV